MVTTERKLTKNIEVKTPLTEEQIVEILKEISEAHQVIEDETLALKVYQKNVKEICNEKDGIITDCLTRYRRGADVKMVECVVEYKDGRATFTDVHTGEIVCEREMEESEQLELVSGRTDAEQIIRQDRERLDNED